MHSLYPLPESARVFSHLAVSQVLKDGSIAVDATAGNGYDTLYLAKLVGDRGQVYTFDIQPIALAHTKERLTNAGLLHRCKLICDTHVNIKKYISTPINVCMFNLGYLPSGDHTITTEHISTLYAIRTALELLKKGGRLSICAYPGHPEGRLEIETICQWLPELNEADYTSLHLVFPNQKKHAPQWFLLERK